VEDIGDSEFPPRRKWWTKFKFQNLENEGRRKAAGWRALHRGKSPWLLGITKSFSLHRFRLSQRPSFQVDDARTHRSRHQTAKVDYLRGLKEERHHGPSWWACRYRYAPLPQNQNRPARMWVEETHPRTDAGCAGRLRRRRPARCITGRTQRRPGTGRTAGPNRRPVYNQNVKTPGPPTGGRPAFYFTVVIGRPRSVSSAIMKLR